MYGTLSVLDTLRASQQTIAQYGEDNAFKGIEAARLAHNDIFNDMLMDFIERSPDRQRRYGGDSTMEMEEVDEFGRSDAQKTAAGVTVGFPLRKYDISVQWTKDFMETATVSELAAQFIAAEDAHLRLLYRQIKRALFYPTNYTFVDNLVDYVELPVKALVNADSAAIPPSPNGVTFDASTLTHYLARAGGSLAASDVSALISTVRQHFASGEVRVYINQAQEAAIRAMTANFTPYFDARIIPGSATTVANGALDQSNMYNRAIGIFDSAEVWVKPWVPANYLFAFVKGAPVPLVLRERMPGRAGLRIVAENEYHPLRTQTLQSEFGIGVWTRTNGAVLYTGDTTYAAPTLN
jgi:hypothetical protein